MVNTNFDNKPVSSNRLGQRPFKPQTRVQVPLLVPNVICSRIGTGDRLWFCLMRVRVPSYNPFPLSVIGSTRVSDALSLDSSSEEEANAM